MFNVIFEGDQSLRLDEAILFYKGHKSQYATIHKIASDENGASLLPGKPLTQAAVCRVYRDFIGAMTIGGFLPENVLSIGVDSLVWWCKPSPRRVFFMSEKLGGQRSAVTPHPGAVFAVKGTDWYVFAVKGNDRPTPEMELFQAPYFNVWAQGKICTGNVAIPKGNVPETITAWENAFFDSQFTHPNIHEANKLVAYRGGSYAFWKSMLNGKHKRFPEKVLVPLNATVADLLRVLQTGGPR